MERRKPGKIPPPMPPPSRFDLPRESCEEDGEKQNVNEEKHKVVEEKAIRVRPRPPPKEWLQRLFGLILPCCSRNPLPLESCEEERQQKVEEMDGENQKVEEEEVEEEGIKVKLQEERVKVKERLSAVEKRLSAVEERQRAEEERQRAEEERQRAERRNLPTVAQCCSRNPLRIVRLDHPLPPSRPVHLGGLPVSPPRSARFKPDGRAYCKPVGPKIARPKDPFIIARPKLGGEGRSEATVKHPFIIARPKLGGEGRSEATVKPIFPIAEEEDRKNKPNLSRSRSRVMRIEGTKGYMAPELQVTGLADQKTDVFALGVVILELLSGSEPLTYRIDEDSGGYERENVISAAGWKAPTVG